MKIIPDTAVNITAFNANVVSSFIKDEARNPQELIAISKALTNTIKVNADILKYYSQRGEKPLIPFYDVKSN